MTSPWRMAWSALIFTAVAAAWAATFILLSQAMGEGREAIGLSSSPLPLASSQADSQAPGHECHLLNMPEPAWEERVTVLESAAHGRKTFMLVRTEDGCRCMLEGAQGVTAPANGAEVKIYGIRLGIPGVTRLQLIAMEIEVPA